MARNKNDDLLMESELAAAFLDDSGDDDATLIETEEVTTSVDSNVEPSDQENDGWEAESEDFPGQLAVDVYETVDKLIVRARIAGISRSDLDVSISDSILTISGTLRGGEEEDVTKWHVQDCFWGEFSRTIALPVQIKEEGVNAALKDGVLTISFEKEKTGEERIVIPIS